MAHIRPATPRDAWYIASRLREADRREVAAASGDHPAISIMTGLKYGEAIVGVPAAGERPVLVAGVTQLSPGVGFPWMVATDRLDTIQIPFLRQCREVVEGWHDRYPRLLTLSHADNGLHHRWLRWCGFVQISRLRGRGKDGSDFIQFERTRQCVTP